MTLAEMGAKVGIIFQKAWNNLRDLLQEDHIQKAYENLRDQKRIMRISHKKNKSQRKNWSKWKKRKGRK